MGLQRVGHDWASELNWIKKTAGLCNLICKSHQTCKEEIITTFRTLFRKKGERIKKTNRECTGLHSLYKISDTLTLNLRIRFQQSSHQSLTDKVAHCIYTARTNNIVICWSWLFLLGVWNFAGTSLTLYRRQWSRLSPRKRNAKRKNGCLMRPLNHWEKKRSKRQRRKGKIYPSEYQVQKNIKER